MTLWTKMPWLRRRRCTREVVGMMIFQRRDGVGGLVIWYISHEPLSSEVMNPILFT